MQGACGVDGVRPQSLIQRHCLVRAVDRPIASDTPD